METRPASICFNCLRSSIGRQSVRRLTRTSLGWTLHYGTTSIPLARQRDNSRRTSIQPAKRRPLATAASPTAPDYNALHARVDELVANVFNPKQQTVPPEQLVLYVLEQIYAIARGIVNVETSSSPVPGNRSATTALLGSVNQKKTRPSITKDQLLEVIGKDAEAIVRAPEIFLTPAILKAYVQLQDLLRKPGSFADIFKLYANKPTPRLSKGKLTLTPTDPESVKAAVDKDTAQLALDAAIVDHDLSLALQIIDTTFATKAYKRAKVLRQCTLPGVGLALIPALAYALSRQYSTWQTMMDPSQATTLAFAGIMTYSSVVVSMGYIALTTANDQMDRVTWVHGTPLWERWVREEERAAFDSIASAWGFKSIEKRGDEAGEDWEVLRETCGRRGFELDRVELMEGMQ